jgi:hypothetical protein
MRAKRVLDGGDEITLRGKLACVSSSIRLRSATPGFRLEGVVLMPNSIAKAPARPWRFRSADEK